MTTGRFLAAFLFFAAFAMSVSARADEAYQKFLKLTQTVPNTYKGGDAAGAAAQANELLTMATAYRHDWNYGNAVHTAHIVLGRIAADEDKLSDARRHLLESVSEKWLPYGFNSASVTAANESKTWKGSPQMDSFGPDMTLASELLKKGESEAVLKYLDECSKFWKMENGSIARWKKQISEGHAPDFGPNMRYVFGI